MLSLQRALPGYIKTMSSSIQVHRFLQSSVQSNSPLLYSKTNKPEEDDLLLKPYYHLVRTPGRKNRSIILNAFNYWMNSPNEMVDRVSEIAQVTHNATLLFDDIEDNSELRRGVPVAHKIFGEAYTLNTASYAGFIALEKVADLGHLDAVKIYVEQMLEAMRGQGLEIYWREYSVCPTEEEYKRMTKKRGGIYNIGVQLTQLFATSSRYTDFGKLTHLLGVYAQIMDDYENLCPNDPYIPSNKSFAGDLTEGKYSFPIIHAIRSNPDSQEIPSILKKRTKDVDLKKHCIQLLRDSGSFEYTEEVMKSLDNQLRDEIAKLGGNPLLEAILVEMKKNTVPRV